MKKSCLILLWALMSIAGKSAAQTVIPCGTDEMNKMYVKRHPEMLVVKKQLEDEIQNFIKTSGKNKLGRKTSGATADSIVW